MDSSSLQWNGPFPIKVDGKLIQGVTGNPALIQITTVADKVGDFVLAVPQGDHISCYFHDNDSPGNLWHKGYELPSLSTSPEVIKSTPIAVSITEMMYNSDVNDHTLAVAAIMTPIENPTGESQDFLVIYAPTTRHFANNDSNGPSEIKANGKLVKGVTGF
jgi:hypothetical protein